MNKLFGKELKCIMMVKPGYQDFSIWKGFSGVVCVEGHCIYSVGIVTYTITNWLGSIFRFIDPYVKCSDVFGEEVMAR